MGARVDVLGLTLQCIPRHSSARLSPVMKGRLMSVDAVDDSSHLAFSAASLSLCTATLSLERSMPDSRLNSETWGGQAERSKMR